MLSSWWLKPATWGPTLQLLASLALERKQKNVLGAELEIFGQRSA
jgi:hypothetical protein